MHLHLRPPQGSGDGVFALLCLAKGCLRGLKFPGTLLMQAKWAPASEGPPVGVAVPAMDSESTGKQSSKGDAQRRPCGPNSETALSSLLLVSLFVSPEVSRLFQDMNKVPLVNPDEKLLTQA